MKQNDSEMNPDDSNMNVDSLDEQIRVTLRAEPSRQQLARLEYFWRKQSRAEGRRRRVRRLAAVAASLLVAGSVSVWLWWPGQAHGPLKTHHEERAAPASPELNQVAPSEHIAVVPSPSVEKSLSAGRPPTTYERFLFTVQTRDSITSESPSLADTVEEVVEQLAGDADADARQLAESSGLAKDDAERLLLRRLLRHGDDQKRAVVRLLAVCGTAHSVPHLLRLSRRETFHDEALAAVQQIVGVEQLAALAGQTTDRRVRAAILNRLLVANSEPALRGYLSLVHHDAVRAEALAAADAVGQPVLASLLDLLDDEDECVRLAAAVVLGHVNGPEVTHALIARVTREPPSSTEAWMALLACRGPRAEAFLAHATRRPRLLGQVNLARVRWARISP